MYSPNPKTKRLEFRPPDPSCNVYLTFAAMLMAGLDGIENKIDPGKPLDKDIFELSKEEMKSVPTMPTNSTSTTTFRPIRAKGPLDSPSVGFLSKPVLRGR